MKSVATKKLYQVVVPDDSPPIFWDSTALMRLKNDPRVAVTVHTSSLRDEGQLIERIKKAHTVISMNYSTPFSPYVLESCTALRHLVVWGAATDNVAANIARSREITISNTPGGTAEAVAEHALALTFAVARRIPELDQRIRYGEWPRKILTQLSGKVMGIIGTGRIARRMVKIAHGIGMKVLITPGHKVPGFKNLEWLTDDVGQVTDFDNLLSASDVVSIHTRMLGTDNGRYMFDRREFALMKPTAILINTAGGLLINEETLAEALLNQTIAGAGIDVFGSEPVGTNSQLIQLPNIILSPHTAALTHEALSTSLNMAVNNVTDFIEGKLNGIVPFTQ